MTLYVLNYNNYYNRIVKKYNTVQEYLDNVEVIYTLEDTNFNPNDNVNTTHTFGWSLATDNYEGDGNYLLVVDEEKDIVSRWFILDSARDTGGQWTCSLRRDVIADNYEAIINAPCFVEKAILSLNDPMIYNSENMTYNQIKTKEYLIKDETNTPWIVAYIAKLAGSDEAVSDKDIKYIYDGPFHYTSSTLENFEGYVNYNEENSKMKTRVNNRMRFEYGNKDYRKTIGENVDLNAYYVEVNEDGTINSAGNAGLKPSLGYKLNYLDANKTANIGFATNYGTWRDNSNTYFLENSNLSDVKSYNNKVVRIGELGNYKYYKISVKTSEDKIDTKTLSYSEYPEIYDSIFSSGNMSKMTIERTSLTKSGLIAKTVYQTTYLDFEEIAEDQLIASLKTKISSTRHPTIDAPYDIITIPLNGIKLGNEYLGFGQEDLILGLSSYIYTALGGGSANPNIYDIQLLPYCPVARIQEAMVFGLDAGEFEEGKDFNYIKKGEENLNVIFYVQTSSFSKIINLSIPEPTNNIDFKVANECDMYRLVSPNYASAFEFSITQNRGVQYIEVNATYKPYNPYIHLNPNWGGLYGSDFNDGRGLVCQGDYSISALTSAWESYQLQNKNFEQIFKRDIESMKVRNSIASAQDHVQAIVGSFSGAMSGATSGAMMSGGNPYVAIGGGIIGGLASLGGGIADIATNTQLRNEALNYADDMYHYNLGNIQATPLSLTKTTSFDINNKIYPFIEYYTATNKEKEALRNKIKYNGMTVMRIDYINNFIREEETYIKGKLIRLEDFNEDYHILNTIGYEVNLGFFTKKEDTN